MFLVGCGSDESICVEDERDLPMLPGVTWTYRVTEDPGGSTQDVSTLIIRSVSDTLNVAWDEGATWEYERSGARRRAVAWLRDGTVSIPFSFRPHLPHRITPVLTFVLPLDPGASWDGAWPRGIDGGTRVRVVSRDTVQVPAGRFEGAYRVVESGQPNPNEVVGMVMHVQPGVGIVRFSYDRLVLGGRDLVRVELMSWTLCTSTESLTSNAPTQPWPVTSRR